MIRKMGSKYCVISHTTGKKMGCYMTEEEAKKRMRQIKFFKNKGKK